MVAKTEKKYRYGALVFAIVALWIASEMARDVAWELQIDPDAWPRVTGELIGCDEKTFSRGMRSNRTVIYLNVNVQGTEDRYLHHTPTGFGEKVRELCRARGSVELKYFFAKGNQKDRWIASLTSQDQGVIFTEQDTLAELQSTGDLVSWFLLILSFLVGAVWAFLIFLGKARLN